MKKTILILFIIIAMLTTVNAQNISFEADGGASLITNTDSEQWNSGYHLGVGVFKNISHNLSLGGRVGFNHWTLKQIMALEILKILDSDLEYSGSSSVLELVPSIRFTPAPAWGQTKQAFGQIGAGCYIYNLKTTISATNEDVYESASTNDTKCYFGITFGGGLLLEASENVKISIGPIYNTIFTKNENLNYYTLSLKILYNKSNY